MKWNESLWKRGLTWSTRHEAFYVVCMGWVEGGRSVIEHRPSLVGSRVTLSLQEVRNYALSPRNFGTPPLYNLKFSAVNRTVTSARRYESRHNTRKSPRPRKRWEAPLNRRFLNAVPTEGERETALINNNTVLRSGFYRIQLFTAASKKRRWGRIFIFSHILSVL